VTKRRPPDSRITAVFADGGCITVNPSPIGGTWACVAVDQYDLHAWQRSGVIRPDDCGRPAVSNNASEFYALLVALEGLSPGWSGRVHSDSLLTLNRFFGGGAMRGLPREWILRGSAALQRLGKLEPIHLSGHPTKAQLLCGIGRGGRPVSKHNVFVDQACTLAGEMLLRAEPKLREHVSVLKLKRGVVRVA
jgi:ribonuclease HI